jgi:hypothetical protein
VEEKIAFENKLLWKKVFVEGHGFSRAGRSRLEDGP